MHHLQLHAGPSPAPYLLFPPRQVGLRGRTEILAASQEDEGSKTPVLPTWVSCTPLSPELKRHSLLGHSGHRCCAHAAVEKHWEEGMAGHHGACSTAVLLGTNQEN